MSDRQRQACRLGRGGACRMRVQVLDRHDSPITQPARLPDRFREVLRCKHYSLRTSKPTSLGFVSSSAGTADPGRYTVRARWACRRHS